MKFSFKKTITRKHIVDGPMSEWRERRKEYEKERNIFQFIRDKIRGIKQIIVQKIRDTRSSIKWAWQRLYRGYDDRILWGTNHYLADIIIEIIKFYKNDAHGITLYNWNEDGEMSSEDSERLNQERLSKMLEGFKIIRDVDKLDRTSEQDEKVKEALEMFAKYFEYLWD